MKSCKNYIFLQKYLKSWRDDIWLFLIFEMKEGGQVLKIIIFAGKTNQSNNNDNDVSAPLLWCQYNLIREFLPELQSYGRNRVQKV